MSRAKKILFGVCWVAGLLPGAGARAEYLFRTIDVPGAAETLVYGLNDHGQVAGTYRLGTQLRGFVRSADGTIFTPVDVPGASAPGTVAVGLNNAGQVAGYYYTRFGFEGFVRSADGLSYSTFSVPGSLPLGSTVASGINDFGRGAGYAFFREGDLNRNRGYVRSADGSAFAVFDVPGTSEGTFAAGINNAGTVVGTYFAGPPSIRAFVRSADGSSFETFAVPGGTITQATAINDLGQVAGYFSGDAAVTVSSFVRGADGSTLETLAVPGATRTFALGLNDAGQVSGYYFDAAGSRHGFLATPQGVVVPEPASFTLFGFSALGLLGYGWRRRKRAGTREGSLRMTRSGPNRSMASKVNTRTVSAEEF